MKVPGVRVAANDAQRVAQHEAAQLRAALNDPAETPEFKEACRARLAALQTTPTGDGLALYAESIVDLMERPLPVQPCWIGPSLLPKGGKLLLGGESKIGKSWLCMELCRALASGRPLWHSDQFVQGPPVKVLYVDQELGQFGLQARGHLMLGAEDQDVLRKNFYYISKTPGLHMDTTRGHDVLAATCERYRPHVLVLDPASRLMEGDDSDAPTVRRLWENVDRLIKAGADREMSVVVAHHYRKPPKDDLDMDDEDRYSFHNFRGSGEWAAAPDTVQTVVRPAHIPNEKSWLTGTQFETRHGPPGKRSYLRIEPAAAATVREISDCEAHAVLNELRRNREADRKARRAAARAEQADEAEPPRSWGR